jgi:hypothetical protein
MENRIVPAVAAGILIARVTDACCACSAGGARPSAVCRAIFEKSVAVFAPRDRGNDGDRLHSDRLAAAIASTHCLQRLFCGKSWHIHTVHSYLPSVGQVSIHGVQTSPHSVGLEWKLLASLSKASGHYYSLSQSSLPATPLRRDSVRLRVNFLEDSKGNKEADYKRFCTSTKTVQCSTCISACLSCRSYSTILVFPAGYPPLVTQNPTFA